MEGEFARDCVCRCVSKFGDGEGTRDAVEAQDDGAAAFSDGVSPSCHAYRLCRASFPGFDSGRALPAGGVMRGGGGSGEGARQPGRIHGAPSCLHAQVRGRTASFKQLDCNASEQVAATAWASCKTELAQERLWLVGGATTPHGS